MLRTGAYLREGQKKDTNIREFVISNETLDRHGTVLKMDGWQLDNYRKNPIVMYAHAANRVPDPDLVIGRGMLSVDGNDLIGRIVFDTEGEGINENKLAKKVLYKIDNGQLSTTSVGFEPKEWGFGKKDKGENPDVFYFRKQELLEFSVVPVPSNPTAGKRDTLDDIALFVERQKDIDTDSSMTLVFEDTPALEPDSGRVQLARARFRNLK